MPKHTKPVYNKLYELQEGRCAICRVSFKLFGRKPDRDHDHVTGAPRGLLCQFCNKGLGMFADDPRMLKRAAGYIYFYRKFNPLSPTKLKHIHPYIRKWR